MSINKARSGLYRAARVLGDVNAVRRGPKAMVKRAVRKRASRGFFSLLRKLLG